MNEKKEPEVEKIDLEPIKQQLASLEARIKKLEDRWNEAIENLEIHRH